MSFLAQGVPMIEQQGLNNIYKGKQNRKSDTNRKKLLAYAQHGEWTKPPTMKIEGKSSVLRLQPHIGDELNPINHLINGAFFAFEQPVVSFLPNFPHSCKPYNL